MRQDHQPTDAFHVCEEAVMSLQAQAAATGVTLSFAYDDLLPGMLLMDAPRLRQTVLDLTAGAVAATRGSVTITAAYARGALHLEADRGKGRSVRLHLPADVATPVHGDLEAPSLEGLKVLVVDDSAVNRALARTLLTRMGVEVSEAEDGRTALDRAAISRFDAILMDIRMPGLSGHQALTALRKSRGPNADVAVLAFTSDAGAEERAARRLDRFDGIVRKPVAPLQLSRAIAAATARALEDVSEERRAASA